ncbi:MAG: alpha/beta hydrolase [Desulfobulbaceae bacterium]|jgi:pimeloyl-ACP methyl ester carboxylesterase|nr:alpha/beta hydrolase [Desulfobulbaceae bacterium]
MATFLFVHGAFQGGWVWRKVIPILQNQGHVVHTPTLSGCGYLYQKTHSKSDLKAYIKNEASYLDTVSGCFYPFGDNLPEYDLQVYINDVANYMAIEMLNEVILVGHSYSGMICGALMMQYPEYIRQSIFIDAIIPKSDRSFADIAGEPFRQMLNQHRLGNDQIRPWPVKIFGIPETETAWFESCLRPFPYQAFHANFPGIFDPAIKKISYISCLHTISPFIRMISDTARGNSWPVYELESGHSPMITCPEALVNALTAIVQPNDAAL